jgi:preprotein translocase subunit YajC
MLEFLISSAFAQEATSAAAKQPSLLASIAPMVLIMAVFYFLIIRPQSKKVNEHKATISTIKKGDQIVTAGGVYGTVTKVDSDKNTLHVQIAEGVQIKIKQDTVAEVINNTVKAAA